MRHFPKLFAVILLAACTETEVRDDAATDTAQRTLASAGISLNDVAGVWTMQAMPENSDSILTTYQLWATNDSLWKMKFDHQPDTLPVRVLAVEADSIRVQIGPYSSALRPGVSVTTFSMYRLAGDTLLGRSVAHYAVATPDSVRYIRTKGVRSQPAH